MVKLRIKELLKERDVSTYKLQQLTGIAPTTLYRYKNNKSQGITLDHITLICKALNCEPGDLFKKTSR